MQVHKKLCLVITLVVLSGLLGRAAPVEPLALMTGLWYVAPDGDDANDCASTVTPCRTINGAIGKAGPGDTVYVAVGVYTDAGTIVFSEVVLLDKDITLSGGWDETFTARNGTSTIDGQGVVRGITVKNGVTAIVEHFLVQNGFAESGGGIISDLATLTLNGSIVSDNLAESEGGGILSNGTLTLNNSAVSRNTAYDSGGGIRAYGWLHLHSSTVSDNIADDNGGGINLSATVFLNNSTISGNQSRNGGAGGITIDGGTLTLNNSTISGNKAGYVNGVGGISNFYGAVTLQNSILAGNIAARVESDCSGSSYTSLGYNLVGSTSTCEFTPGPGDLTGVEAKLGPLEGSPGYHPLLFGSPAIDAGNPMGCTDGTAVLTTDQRGRPRLGSCDIGAYEAQALELSSKGVSQSFAVPGTLLAFDIILRNIADVSVGVVGVTDAIPIWLSYQEGSLTATSGMYEEAEGVITWTGELDAGETVSIAFKAAVAQAAPEGLSIVNSAVISGTEETITRSASFKVGEVRVCGLKKYENNPVLWAGDDSIWDRDDIWAPAVLRDGGGYKMWYTGDDGSGPSQIGLATSANGVNWTKEPSNPVLTPRDTWEAAGVASASVLLDSGVYKMWYTGFDDDGVARIGYATSGDGVNWTKHGGNPVLDVGTAGSWEDADVVEPTVIKERGTFHMWYVGNAGMSPRIGHATSADGIDWTKDGANPVVDLGPIGDWDWLYVYGPEAVVYDGSYLLWYSGGTLPTAWQTGYATSANGDDWTRQGILLPQGDPHTFDVKSADYPAVVVHDAVFRVWYSGLNDTGTFNIGYATAEVCGVDDDIAPPVYNAIYLPAVLKGWSTEPSCPPYYSDDFGDRHSGWPIDEDDDRKYDYTEEQYQILVKEPSQLWFVTPGAQATDFQLTVSARRTEGAFGAYGVLFGINEDWSEFYQVLIDYQHFSIWRFDGSWTALQDWTFSTHIRTGSDWNRIKLVRNGADVSVYVNNQHLATVTDGSLAGLRRIGLVAAAPSNSHLDARFDDFALYPIDYPARCGEVSIKMQSAVMPGSMASNQAPALLDVHSMVLYQGGSFGPFGHVGLELMHRPSQFDRQDGRRRTR